MSSSFCSNSSRAFHECVGIGIAESSRVKNDDQGFTEPASCVSRAAGALGAVAGVWNLVKVVDQALDDQALDKRSVIHGRAPRYTSCDAHHVVGLRSAAVPRRNVHNSGTCLLLAAVFWHIYRNPCVFVKSSSSSSQSECSVFQFLHFVSDLFWYNKPEGREHRHFGLPVMELGSALQALPIDAAASFGLLGRQASSDLDDFRVMPPDIVMACIYGHIVMACIAMAYIIMAHVGMVCIVRSC